MQCASALAYETSQKTRKARHLSNLAKLAAGVGGHFGVPATAPQKLLSEQRASKHSTVTSNAFIFLRPNKFAFNEVAASSQEVNLSVDFISSVVFFVSCWFPFGFVFWN
jgi:hypothetical protein